MHCQYFSFLDNFYSLHCCLNSTKGETWKKLTEVPFWHDSMLHRVRSAVKFMSRSMTEIDDVDEIDGIGTSRDAPIEIRALLVNVIYVFSILN